MARRLPTEVPYLTLNQIDSGGGTDGDLFGRPDGGLDFAYVGFLKQEHAQTALPYASAYRMWQFAGQKPRMETKRGTLFAPPLAKLLAKRSGAHPYTH